MISSSALLNGMKIRIKGNSIRLRLSQNETIEFGKSGKLEEIVEFGLTENQRLTFVLMAETEAEYISANLENGEISVVIPRKI